ncbi:hypothetical protein BVY01_00135 [bacterium I07]|nr:hypothetical protein BVY01_00135 [bacterium I07]
MKNYIKIISALLIVGCSSPKRNVQDAHIVFTNVSVIDVRGTSALSDMTIILAGDRIKRIGKTSKIDIPDGALVIDAHGKYLIPGLWDMHVHVLRKNLYPMKNIFFPLFIANGITGLRDTGGQIETFKQFRKESIQNNFLCPIIMASGPILDGPPQKGSSYILCTNEAEGRQAVHTLEKEGVDFIKIIEHLSRDVYTAIADEVKKSDLTFVGHPPYSLTITEASNAGLKCIEHFSCFLPGCSSDELNLNFTEKNKIINTYDETKAQLLCQLLKTNNTYICPTLVLDHYKCLIGGGHAHLGEPDPGNDIRVKYMPINMVKERWPKTLKSMVKRQYMYDNITAEGAYANNRFLQKELEWSYQAHLAGVEFIAGTDCPVVPHVLPGFSLHEELFLYVKAGLTPIEALKTATLNPATFLGMQDSLGTIDQGKLANLVLLDADPLENIRNIQKINAVVLKGQLFTRNDLDALLENVELLAGSQ